MLQHFSVSLYKGAGKQSRAAGFALPTIVISSVILFAVLVATIGVVSSAKTSLDGQFYTALAGDAAEAGVLHASACLKDSSNVSPWGSNKLFPTSFCSGDSSCTSPTSCPLLSTSTYVTSYTVEPVTNGGNGVQTAKVTGTVSLLRASSGTVWRTYTKVVYMAAGADVSASQVAFGYVGGGGAFFGAIATDGKMRTIGYNANGQLGNGTTTTATTPTVFNVGNSSPVVAGYTNFLSVGYGMFALTADGDLWGAGANANGQLGNGSTATAQSTPARVLLPAGVKARSATAASGANFFVTTDNNVYAAGTCSNGILGSNYTISGCTNQSVPVRVNLPTPNVSDPDTIPTDNIVSDRYNTYIRMAGGRVYGWGANEYGQLGVEDFQASSNPVKIGTFGDSGKTNAIQIASDGVTLSILDDQGKVYSLGANTYGTMGSTAMKLRFPKTSEVNYCMTGTATTATVATCATGGAQDWQMRTDGSIYNATYNVCLNTTNGTAITAAACNASSNQTFTWAATNEAYGYLTSSYNGRCLANSSGTTLTLATCSVASTQYVRPYNVAPTQFSVSGTVTKMASDQWSLSVMTATGDVWSSGINVSGQFGNGTTSTNQMTPVKFATPGGVAAADIAEASAGTPTDRQNLVVIGTDGRVYGAGSNQYGQLGNGSTSGSPVTNPVQMQIFDGSSVIAKRIQTGYGTTVIISTTGEVYTVGNNDFGQIGDGTTTARSTPVKAKYTNNLRDTIY
jgi:alpha-tubulin suppressor-like RCC1 family protein